jgi:iron complex transport system permease protein
MLVSSLLIGFIVSQCGIIGYVGLIIPHVARGLVGTDHKRLVPFAVFLGALFMLWCDVAAQSILNLL